MSAHSNRGRLAAAIYLCITLAGGAFVANAHRDDDPLVVSVLGAGDRLSVLVTVGNASLLITAGDDASAFANAVARARPFFANRVDLLVIAGDRGDLPAASRAIDDVAYRRIYVLEGPLRAHLADLGLSQHDVLNRPVAIELPRGVVVTLDPGREGTGSSAQWSAIVEQDGTRVAIGGGDASSVPSAAAAVISGRVSGEALMGLAAPLLVVPAAWDSTELRAGLDSLSEQPDWVARVAAGDVARLRFVDGGVQIPPNAAPLPPRATPASDPATDSAD